MLIVLLLLSAFFSGSETALMMLNRHRLNYLVGQGHGGAKLTKKLLERPDRLIGVILIGNNFVNISASSITTLITIELFGEWSVAVVTGLLTLVIIIFSEVTPKTIAAMHPELIAFPSAYVYDPLLKALYPIVWLINSITHSILRIFHIKIETNGDRKISQEEFRTVVQEASTFMPPRSQEMLLGILDLGHVMVEDIMVARNDVYGIDLQDPTESIMALIRATPYSTMPLYDGNIDNLVGMFHAKEAMHYLLDGVLNKEQIKAISKDPYFVPKGTDLYKQLLNFQRNKNRVGLVVDEYGDFLGLITLSDILEEIVGEFTTDPANTETMVHTLADGSVLIDCGIHVRDLNHHFNWHLPTNGPKTLNGLILDYMETIPEPGTSMELHGYRLETVHTTENSVKTVRHTPRT